ncbi:transposase [Neptunomonas qingdaonensis]|uniref:Transposase, IS5 family n=1 Tax=Neptunomonas qingdaonensis TaxID=1045558 RepID=A0A1I2QWJ2_9GAMM|nr:transposase [Neptunomonas qingdaonensis]SFG30016.1 transposase, IS5 family [Neptunomonas qingdaonensis]
MLPNSPVDSAQTGFFDIANQLNANHPLLALGRAIDWSLLEHEFKPLYSARGRNVKPIRLMSGLLMLKQLYNLSDEAVVAQWQNEPLLSGFLR